MSAFLVSVRSRSAPVLVAAVAAVTAVAVPAGPAHAQADCVAVAYESHPWSTSNEAGGFVLTVTLDNLCDNAIDGWTVDLTLAPDHTVDQVWNAVLSGQNGSQVTLRNAGWNELLTPNSPVSFGMFGRWTGAPSDPVSCHVNGVPCVGVPQPNQPPVVTVTSPTDGEIVPVPSIVTFAADASEPDGDIDRVVFYLDGDPVQADTTAPYEVSLLFRLPNCSCTVVARAYDDGDPQLFTDSEPVTFQMVTVPPLQIIAEPATLEVPAGGSAVITVTIGVATTANIEMVVQGDAGITVSPATFTLDSSNWNTGQEVVVSAAAGTEGATATVYALEIGGSDTVAVTVVSPE